MNMKRWSYNEWKNGNIKVFTRSGKPVFPIGWYANTFVGCVGDEMIAYDENTGKRFGQEETSDLDLFLGE